MADPADLESVRQALAQNREQLMRAYRAVGVGIGAREPGSREYAIVVYLKSAEDMPAETAAVEGVPLKFVVSGEFKAQL